MTAIRPELLKLILSTIDVAVIEAWSAEHLGDILRRMISPLVDAGSQVTPANGGPTDRSRKYAIIERLHRKLMGDSFPELDLHTPDQKRAWAAIERAIESGERLWVVAPLQQLGASNAEITVILNDLCLWS